MGGGATKQDTIRALAARRERSGSVPPSPRRHILLRKADQAPGQRAKIKRGVGLLRIEVYETMPPREGKEKNDHEAREGGGEDLRGDPNDLDRKNNRVRTHDRRE